MTKKGTKTYTYNAANEITNAGFTYDQNGNMTSVGKFNYLYNHENQLTTVTKVSDGTIVATYSYDYRGLRISKTTGTATVYYHWDDQDRLIRESDSNGNTSVLYIYSENQLVAIEKNGVMYYVHTNHHGDILALSDSNGNQVATYKYGPWGEFLGKTGTVDIPIRYAGYSYDEETSLYYLKARYYNPELGRFLIRDNIEYIDFINPQSLNLYSYANNNPLMYIDPTGHFYWNTRKMSYGKRFELHLNNSEAKSTANHLAGLSDYWGSGIAALGKGPWYARVAVAAIGVYSMREIKKLGREIKNKNKGRGVYIIYGAYFSSGKAAEKDRDFNTPYAVRSK